MHPLILFPVSAAALALATLGGIAAARDRVPGRAVAIGIRVTVALAALQAVVAGVQLLLGAEVHEKAAVIGYLLGSVAALPVALSYSQGEPNRWSGLVVAVGGVAVAVMCLRLAMLWPLAAW